MKKLLLFLFLLSTHALIGQNGEVYYVATDGDDSNNGTSLDTPWATWKKALRTMDAGDTIYIRGGVYYSDTMIYVNEYGYGNAGGTAENPILVAGYPADILSGNWPILDCRYHCDLMTSQNNIYNSAIKLKEVEYITLRCLEIRNVWQCDSVNAGAIEATYCSNMTYERLRIHDIGCARGFYQTSGSWNQADSAYSVDILGHAPKTLPFEQPDTTKWINCDIWNVMDTLEEAPGNAADCWKTISRNGNYYEWNGCRAWNYGDDGFDPNSGHRVFIDCWAMSSSKYANVESADIEGNGFKTSPDKERNKEAIYNIYLPGYWDELIADSLVRHYNCLTLFNVGAGFYNHILADTSDNPLIYNCTSFADSVGYADGYAGLSVDSVGNRYKNCIAYAARWTQEDQSKANVRILYSEYYVTHSTWEAEEGGGSSYLWNANYNIDSSDFITTDSLTLVSLFTAPRKPDGSLPDERPLMLRSDSDLRDGGINVGLPFYGDHPDLGYIEYRLTSGFDMQDTIPLSCIVDITYTGGALASATYHWDFDGATVISGSGQGPYTVEWPSLGIKTVSLYVEELGQVSDTTDNNIYISELTSGFTLQDTAGLSNNVDITYTGNASPSATYHWDFDSATVISGSGQGPYTVEWLSMGDKTVSLFIEEPNYISDTSTNNIYIGELTSSFDSQDTAYLSGTVDIIYTGNASSSATYNWDFDSATIISGAGQGPYTVEWPNLGDKTVSLYVEDASFISDTTTKDICISELTSNFDMQDIACISNTVDIIYSGNASDSAIYFWDFGNATILNGSGQGPYTVIWPNVGDKTVSLHVEECNSVSDTSTNDIYIKNNPVFTIIPYPNDTVTTLDTITLMGISASSYLWSTGDVTQSIDAFNNNGPMGGNQEYWLQITDETGCIGADSIVVLFAGPTLTDEFPNDIEIINVYPNPFDNYLNVEAMIPKKGQYMFEVVDTIGRTVKQELRNLNPGVRKIRLDPIYGYPGVYILFVRSDDGTVGFTKIIKYSN